jgi:hypothetical protein
MTTPAALIARLKVRLLAEPPAKAASVAAAIREPISEPRWK